MPAGPGPGAIAVANVDPEHAIAAFAGDAGAQQALLPAHNRVKARFPFGPERGRRPLRHQPSHPPGVRR